MREVGLTCNRCVSVNDYLQTSDPSVFAFGEIAEWRGNIWGITALIQRPIKKIDFQSVVHQCGHCLTVYDPRFGEPMHGIMKGVAFDALPDTFICPTCEAGKEDFVVFKDDMKIES